MNIINFINNLTNFGLIFAINNFAGNHLNFINPKISVSEKRDTNIKKYLKKKYTSIINEYNSCGVQGINQQNRNPYTIWVCWQQGEDNMPDIMKICFNNIKRYANGNQVILITDNNYMNYVTIPDYIIKKVKKGKISRTHFSDILRICLLYEHGGLWLDSTVLLTSPLEEMLYDFFSMKCKNDLWEHIGKKRWLSYYLYSVKHNILFDFTRRIFFEYTKHHNMFIDYYLIDYIFDMGYDTIPAIRKLIDDIPVSNATPSFIGYFNYEKKFDSFEFNQLCLTTHFHKLIGKKCFRKFTEDNELTYYGFILQNFGLIKE